MKETTTTAQKTADELLEQPIILTLGGEKYEVPRPTLGTLIRLSAEIEKLPDLPDYKDPQADDKENSVRFIQANLAVAKDCTSLATILAIAILGEQRLTEEQVVRKRVPMPGILGKIGLKHRVDTTIVIDNLTPFAEHLRKTLTPSPIQQALVTILNHADLGDFFASIAFLNGVNMMRKATTTARGQ